MRKQDQEGGGGGALHDLISSAAEGFILSKAATVAIVESCSENDNEPM